MDLISDSPSRDAKLIDEERCELVIGSLFNFIMKWGMSLSGREEPFVKREIKVERRDLSWPVKHELVVGCWSTDRQNRQRKRLAAPSDYVRRTGAKWTTDADGRQSMQYYSYRRRRRRRRHHNLQSHMYSSKR